MWTVIAGAGLLGLMSSAHCIGMCGPLAMSLPVHHLSGTQQLVSMLLYHLGRIITYSLLGLLFGIAGRGLYLAGFQQWFSIGTGIIMLLLAVHYFSGNAKGYPKWAQVWYQPLQQVMAQLLRQRSTSSFLFLGMANGLLPCGMVYISIVAAIGLGHALQSAVFMMVFGLGTFPAMFLFNWFGIRIGMDVRIKFRRAVPFIIAFMGLILILRGMNLGIPFISPVLGGKIGSAVGCH